MSRRGAVQRKVPCLFVTEVKEEPSAKRERQVAGAARGRAGGREGGREMQMGSQVHGRGLHRAPPPAPCPLNGGKKGRLGAVSALSRSSPGKCIQVFTLMLGLLFVSVGNSDGKE